MPRVHATSSSEFDASNPPRKPDPRDIRGPHFALPCLQRFAASSRLPFQEMNHE